MDLFKQMAYSDKRNKSCKPVNTAITRKSLSLQFSESLRFNMSMNSDTDEEVKVTLRQVLDRKLAMYKIMYPFLNTDQLQNKVVASLGLDGIKGLFGAKGAHKLKTTTVMVHPEMVYDFHSYYLSYLTQLDHTKYANLKTQATSLMNECDFSAKSKIPLKLSEPPKMIFDADEVDADDLEPVFKKPAIPKASRPSKKKPRPATPLPPLCSSPWFKTPVASTETPPTSPLLAFPKIPNTPPAFVASPSIDLPADSPTYLGQSPLRSPDPIRSPDSITTSEAQTPKPLPVVKIPQDLSPVIPVKSTKEKYVTSTFRPRSPCFALRKQRMKVISSISDGSTMNLSENDPGSPARPMTRGMAKTIHHSTPMKPRDENIIPSNFSCQSESSVEKESLDGPNVTNLTPKMKMKKAAVHNARFAKLPRENAPTPLLQEKKLVRRAPTPVKKLSENHSMVSDRTYPDSLIMPRRCMRFKAFESLDPSKLSPMRSRIVTPMLKKLGTPASEVDKEETMEGYETRENAEIANEEDESMEATEEGEDYEEEDLLGLPVINYRTKVKDFLKSIHPEDLIQEDMDVMDVEEVPSS
ncbi:proteoglycan 4-like [Neocloeon triangulifer]|uniref:proteoglycan 4-like n=1 Tax=Neocloeon triangulifer TaxID=2078957 RepID=UPI00286F1DFA|nr:proteoglycan 4-like [Neocloeon triangulifer]XP_059477707.1 proteoglycan 4-like [Neocloeon triangulifer]